MLLLLGFLGGEYSKNNRKKQHRKWDSKFFE